LYIYITAGTLLQQYDLATSSWIDRTPVVRGPTGPTGATGPDGQSINVTISEEPPLSPQNGDIWVDSNADPLVEPYNPNIQSHISSTNNPHTVTKTHVGLSNVDNVQQMPISYLDTDATFTANSDAKVPSQKAVRIYIKRALIPDCIGIEWNSTYSSPILTRIDEDNDTIIGLTGAAFDNHPIYENIKRCILTPEGVPTFGSDAKGTGLDLTSGLVMVNIPRVYVKFENLNPIFRWKISSVPKVGYELFYNFLQRGHSAYPANQMYVGAYTAGANGGTTAANGVTNTIAASNWTGLKLTSKSGVKSLTSGTVAQMETAGNLIGTGWGLTNFWTWNLLQLLFYVEYASFDSQSKLGQGRTNGSNTAASINGMYLDQVGEGAGVDVQSLLAANGSYGDTVGSYLPAVWRGIENIWGNLYQFCPGYNPTDTEHHILKRDGTGTISGNLASGSYETVTSPAPLNGVDNISGTDAGAYCNGYVQGLAFDTAGILNLTFTPNVLTGSSSTYLCDRYYSHSAGLGRNGVLLVGGNWKDGGSAGIGYRIAHNDPEIATSAIGGRAEFIG